MSACANGWSKADVEALIKQGAKLHATDINNDTALHLAVREDHGEIASYIVDIAHKEKSLQKVKSWSQILNREGNKNK